MGKLLNPPRVLTSEECEVLFKEEDKALEQKYLRLLEKRQEIDRRILEVLNELRVSHEMGELIRDIFDAEKKEKTTAAGV